MVTYAWSLQIYWFVSFVKLAEHSSCFPDPIVGMTYWGQINMNNEISWLTSSAQNTLAFTSFVAWAGIFLFISYIVISWFEMNQRHSAVQFTWMLIVNDLFFSVPARTIHKETVYIDTSIWFWFNFIDCFSFKNSERELKLVNFNAMQSSMSLQATRHETLREE